MQPFGDTVREAGSLTLDTTQGVKLRRIEIVLDNSVMAT